MKHNHFAGMALLSTLLATVSIANTSINTKPTTQNALYDSAQPLLLTVAQSSKKKRTQSYGGARQFVFDPCKRRWYAYRGGKLIRSGVASGGANYCKDIGRSCRTPRGVFTVIRKGGPGCRSSRYPKGGGGAWMGWCIAFHPYYLIHASHSVPSTHNASHGCIRVKKDAAIWLNQNFLHVGDKVIVKPYC
ncbi:MAG: hypothetical protein A3F17_06900 [Gammaproteobacteria bacterium RIFCSPHIGHO2_12_FULL_41_15]|nr:MAG: hypothetical protein A3F17_06900 [Gammaproteobacteria bacterium RIFCSPHIGHO2_12_FULL_41_15]